MKNVLTLTLTLLITSSLFGEDTTSGFTLEGKFLQDYSGYIYLKYEGKKDSALVSGNRFSFKGKVNDISSAALFVNVKSRVNHLPGIYLENTAIKVTLSLKDKPLPDGRILANLELVSVEGTKTAGMEQQHRDFYEKNKSNTDFTKLLVSRVNQMIAEHPAHPFAGTAFFRLTSRNDVDKSVLVDMYSRLKEKSLSDIQRRKIERLLFPEKSISVNDPVFNFSLPDQNGKIFNTASLKGQWYLIDFWASWCGPCRKQLPDLKKVYDENKNKNFQVLGISIDEKHESWTKALGVEKLDWPNVIEDAGFGGTIATRYQITAIPMNFLVNPEGKIVAKDISINKLGELLKGRN
jgi:thiol-disulfide isomerase/thioredoxin